MMTPILEELFRGPNRLGPELTSEISACQSLAGPRKDRKES